MIRRSSVFHASLLVACIGLAGDAVAQYYFEHPFGAMMAPDTPILYQSPTMFDLMTAQNFDSPAEFETTEIPSQTAQRRLSVSHAAFLQAETQPSAPQSFVTPIPGEEADETPSSIEPPFEELPMNDAELDRMGAEAPYADSPDYHRHCIHILKYPGVVPPPNCCPDSRTGNCDHDLKRYLTKEEALNDPCCDPKCLVCVKEPFICQKCVMEETEVVFFRCFKYTQPFCDSRCEDQRCIQETGHRTVKKLEPCTVKVKIPCKKTVIDYRTVWICIKCKDKHPYGP